MAFEKCIERFASEWCDDKVDRIDGGLYHGAAGVAYACWTILTHCKESEGILSAKALTLVQRAFNEYYGLVKKGGFLEPKGRHCGIANDALALILLKVLVEEDLTAANALCDIAEQMARDPKTSNEWLYGRSGLLYILRTVENSQLLKSKDASAERTAIDQAIEHVIASILATPRPWIWHDT